MKDRQKGQTVWEFRFYEIGNDGRHRRRSLTVGTVAEYPNESAAMRSAPVQAALLEINAGRQVFSPTATTMGGLIARCEREEMPTRYSTRTAYQSIVNQHIRPRWADMPLSEVKTMAVEKWLNSLPLAPKPRAT